MIFTKKAYQKPSLLFEDFTIMDAITVTCAIPAQHGDKYTCAWFDDSIQNNVFTEVVSACIVTEGMYDVPQDIVFSS